MKTKSISVRGIAAEVWQDFRAFVVKSGLNMGEATTEALRLYLKKIKTAKPKYRFLDLKPVDFGPGNENLSERIDEILYDKKK